MKYLTLGHILCGMLFTVIFYSLDWDSVWTYLHIFFWEIFLIILFIKWFIILAVVGIVIWLAVNIIT